MNKTTFIYHIIGYDTLAATVKHINEIISEKALDPDDVRIIFLANYITPVYDGAVDATGTNNILKLVDILKLYCNKYGILDIKQYYVNNKYAWFMSNKVLGNLGECCVACTVLNAVYKYCYAIYEQEDGNTPTIVLTDKCSDGNICGPAIQSIRLELEEFTLSRAAINRKTELVNVVKVQVPDALGILNDVYKDYINIEADILEPKCLLCGLGDNNISRITAVMQKKIADNIEAILSICELGVLAE